MALTTAQFDTRLAKEESKLPAPSALIRPPNVSSQGRRELRGRLHFKTAAQASPKPPLTQAARGDPKVERANVAKELGVSRFSGPM